MVSLRKHVLAVRAAVESKIEADEAFRAWQESEGDGGGRPLLNDLARWHEDQSEAVQVAFKLQDWHSAGGHVPWKRDRERARRATSLRVGPPSGPVGS